MNKKIRILRLHSECILSPHKALFRILLLEASNYLVFIFNGISLLYHLFPLRQRCTLEKTPSVAGIWNSQLRSLSSIFHWVNRSIKLLTFSSLLEGKKTEQGFYIFLVIYLKTRCKSTLKVYSFTIDSYHKFFLCSCPYVRVLNAREIWWVSHSALRQSCHEMAF